MPESIECTVILTASPEQVYKAWLDSEAHSQFTGGKATVEDRLEGRFTAWDGYISGTNLELEPYKRIVQAWRTTDFPADSPDSRLEIQLTAIEGGTRLSLIHTEIPDGQSAEYAQGWTEYYFETMKVFFSR